MIGLSINSTNERTKPSTSYSYPDPYAGESAHGATSTSWLYLWTPHLAKFPSWFHRYDLRSPMTRQPSEQTSAWKGPSVL
jgi:hypothetical protein